jgi:hypothetical protein
MRPCRAQEYQFTWSGNRLLFSQISPDPTYSVAPTHFLDPSPTIQPSIFEPDISISPSPEATPMPPYFSYAFQLNQSYPKIESDLPLQVFTVNQQPLFWNSARVLASLPLEVEWYFSREFLPFLSESPGYDLWRYFSLFSEIWTFYQQPIWLTQINTLLQNTDTFQEILAIREEDKSLTLSFRFLQERLQPVRLWLSCQDENGAILQEELLQQKDSFLWQGASFSLFLGEAEPGTQLLFSLPENSCNSELSLRSQQQDAVFSDRSPAVPIIPVEELR